MLEGYTILEYIESTGSQYIDTGFKHNNNTRVVMKVLPTAETLTANAFLFDGAGGNTSRKGVFYQKSKSKWAIDYGSDSKRQYLSNASVNSTLSIDYNKNVCTVNDETITFSSTTFQSTVNLALLATNYQGTVQAFISARLYSCKIYDNDILVRDYIPCEKNGEYGLYDNVNNKFYVSATDTGFSGKWKEPKYLDVSMQEFRHRLFGFIKGDYLDNYQVCEYIESNGTQYINTDYKPNPDTKICIDADFLNTNTTYNCVFGVNNASDAQFAMYRESNTVMVGQFNYLSSGTWKVTVDTVYGRRYSELWNSGFLFGENGFSLDKNYTYYYNPLYICALNDLVGGKATLFARMKIYSYQIYEGGVLVQDCVPVVNKEGVYGMYDKVNGVFYASATTSQFTGASGGTHKLPDGYEKADSCYADGNAYLDTGLTVEKTDVVTMEMDILLEGTAAWAGAYYWLEYKSDVSNGVRSILKVESDGTGICNIYDDGNLVRTWDYTSRSYSTVKLGIFKLGNQNNTWTTTSSFPHQVGTLYSCKIWKNGKLVRDFIPCVNVEDGIYYLFDKVEGVIYDSAGTSHFGEKKTVYDFDYTGAVQSVTLKSGTYKLEVWGAQGGVFTSSIVNRGGYSVGTIELSKDTQMFVYVGGQPVASGTEAGDVNLGGFNGGGSAIVSDYNVITYAQGGGGGTDIRIGTDSLYARVIVAGGGAGDSGTDSVAELYGGGKNGGGGNDGYFGGTQNGSGTASTSSTIKGGFGVGANAKPSATNYNYVASGGGGGWYGGCSSTIKSDSNSNYCFRCGGGSGYVYTSENASNFPTGCLLNSSYYLTDSETIGGNSDMTEPDGSYSTKGHVGSGYARITKL